MRISTVCSVWKIFSLFQFYRSKTRQSVYNWFFKLHLILNVFKIIIIIITNLSWKQSNQPNLKVLSNFYTISIFNKSVCSTITFLVSSFKSHFLRLFVLNKSSFTWKISAIERFKMTSRHLIVSSFGWKERIRKTKHTTVDWSRDVSILSK